MQLGLEYHTAPWYIPVRMKYEITLSYHRETCVAPRTRRIQTALDDLPSSLESALREYRTAGLPPASANFHLPGKLIIDFGNCACSCGAEQIPPNSIASWIRSLYELQDEPFNDGKRGMEIVIFRSGPSRKGQLDVTESMWERALKKMS